MKKSNVVYKGGICSAFLSIAFGALVATAAWKFANLANLPSSQLDQISRAFGGVLAQISLMLAGFIITSTAIFTALGDKPLIQNMYKSGHAAALILHMYIAIGFNIAACVLGMWTLINTSSSLWTVLSLIGLGAACIFSLLGVMRKLWFVLHYINGTPVSQESKNYKDVDHSTKTIPAS